LDYYLQNSQFAKEVTVYTVASDELLVKRVNGEITQVLEVGRYIEFKDIQNSKVEILKINSVEPISDLSLTELSSAPLAGYRKVFNIEMGQVGLLMVNQTLTETLRPGKYFFWRNHHDVQCMVVDKRWKQLEISGQEILTKDKVNIRTNVSVAYRVVDAVKSTLEIKEFQQQLYVLAQNEIRNLLSSLTLDDMLAQKSELGVTLLDGIQSQALELGVEIVGMGVKDVILPGEIKTIMNKVLVAEKQALANTIIRREETAATRSLLNTAKLMENNPMMFKLKEMEYVEKIAEKVGEISISGNGKMINELKTIFTR
jgi:hypothetical protein